MKFLPSNKRTYLSYEIDLYIKLPVKINNITNKRLEKVRESEGGGGGGAQTHKNFKYCIRPFQPVHKERTERTLGRRLKYSSFIYLIFTM